MKYKVKDMYICCMELMGCENIVCVYYCMNLVMKIEVFYMFYS